MFSFVNDTVLDPFVGTATTMVAAAEAGRNSIGVEIDPKYWRLARNRLGKVFPSMTAKRTVEFLHW